MGKKDSKPSQPQPHRHNWVVSNQKIKGGTTFIFWVCTNPGCPNPSRMEVVRGN